MDALKDEQKRILRMIDLMDQSADLPPLVRATASHTRPSSVRSNPQSATSRPAPIGRLSREVRGNSVYCYEHFYQNGKRVQKKYLGTVKSTAVRNHLAARFCEEKLRILRSDQQILEKLAAQYRPYDSASVISDMPRTYQTVAAENSFEEAFNARYEELWRWAHADYPRNSLPFPDAKNMSMDGKRTRSKGETTYHDAFHELGVLYRYDCLIEITDPSGNVHLLSPDFLIQCFDGSFIIVEHLGRLDSLKYAMDFGEKCHLYLQAGFILGKNFFVTSDDAHGGTDSQIIHDTVKIIERLFYGY